LPKETATATLFPDAPLSLPKPELTPETRSQVGIAVKQLIDVNLGNRQQYDYALDTWNAIYEMRTQPNNTPWPNSANVVLPVVHSAVNEYVSRINGTIFVPRLFTVRGNDPVSSQYAHLVEQYYNAKADELEWYDPWETCVHLSARDGVAYSMCWWELSTHSEIRIAQEPVMGPDGQPTGEKKAVKKRITMVDYDAPKFTAKESRDVVFIPNYATSVETADAVAIKIYMGESDMWKMCGTKDAPGIFDRDIVAQILNYDSAGQGELTWDTQGYRTYTISGLITVADTAVAAPEGVPMTRGPVEMWLVITNQFDFDNDGVFEDNVVWVHDRSRLCPGVAPFEYWKGRPIFPLSLIPRPNRIYGFSIPQIGRGIQEECDTQHNQRLNWMDMLLQPIRYRTPGVRISEEDRVMGPGTELRVTKKDDFGYIPMQDVPPSSVPEENLLLQYFDRAMGAPQASSMQVPNGARQSARAAQAQAAIQGMMTNLVLRRVRKWLLQNFKYAASLTQQYGTNQVEAVSQTDQGSQTIVLPKEVLSLNYSYGIAGQGGPLDKEQRRQDMMMLVQLLTGTPLSALLQGNLPRLWMLARSLVETFDIPEVTTFIGTMQEAQQQQQAQQQAAQQQQQAMQQAELMKQVFAHDDFKQPTAPAQKQPQQQQQPAMMS
jgi:hypothetical protein